MGPKRASEGELPQVTKVPKLEQGSPSSPLSQHQTQNADFSQSVKKKLASSTRTGQACDRCKVRATQAIAKTRASTRRGTVSGCDFLRCAVCLRASRYFLIDVDILT